jgi:hypothetical protein
MRKEKPKRMVKRCISKNLRSIIRRGEDIIQKLKLKKERRGKDNNNRNNTGLKKGNPKL